MCATVLSTTGSANVTFAGYTDVGGIFASSLMGIPMVPHVGLSARTSPGNSSVAMAQLRFFQKMGTVFQIKFLKF